MSTFLNDTFTDTDGTTLPSHTGESGATWVQVSDWLGSGGQLITSGGLAVVNAPTYSTGTVKSTAVAGSADCVVSMPMRIVSSISDWVGVGLRMPAASTAGMGYILLVNATTIALWKMTGGTPSQFFGAGTVAYALPADADYVFKIEAVGSTITGKIQRSSDGNWLTSAGTWQAGEVVLVTATDSTYSAAGVTIIHLVGTTSAGARVYGISATDTTSSAATAVTMSGPSSGTVGAASTNFTVGANGTITGAVVVTPSDGGAGGTFSPTTVSISSGTPTATFAYTPASSGAKTISVTNNGGLTNPSNITYTASGAVVTVPITDTNIFLSPYNWYSDGAGAMQSNNVKASSTFAWTNMRGAYAKFKATVGASGSIKLNVSGASLSALSNSAGAPTLAWSVAGGAVQTHLMATADTQITLASGLGAGTYDVFLWHRSVYVTQDGDNWTTPVNRIQITGIELSTGGSLSAPTLKPKRMVVYGDSITEGDINVNGTRSASSQDAIQTYGWYLSEILNAEVGIIGFWGKQWSWFSSTWSSYSSGKSRLIAGTLSPAPDYVLINYGENDGNPGPVSATVTSDLAAVKTAAPSARIILNIPFSGVARTNLAAATLPIGAIKTDLARYEMLGGNLQWSFDGQHPTAQGHANLAALLATPILSTAPTGTARTITLNLVNVANAAQASLTGLTCLFWEQAVPDSLTAPTKIWTNQTTDGAGQLVLTATTQLASGGVGWFLVTNSVDGNPATAHKLFSGPVTVT